MGSNLTNLFYLVTIVTFILALRYLSSPAHARRGNQIGAVGMLVAIAVTFAKSGLTSSWEIALGMVIAAHNPWLAAISIASFALIYFPAIELEEQHLRDIFPQYAAYAERVHRFVPLAVWKGSRARFSWARYRRNEEYKSLIGFILAVAWLVWKCTLRKTAP